jgi:4-amino-4-deoxy-L-arabinose transferase-like glycosyltransferase
VKQIQKVGIWNYDAVVRVYVERQYKLREAVVPATRLAFLVPAALCADWFKLRAFTALHLVVATGGVLFLFLCALFAYRLGGVVPMIGMTALIATAPLQVYLCQRAMIDGYFALWAVAALWLGWENLQRPRHFGCLVSYTLCLAILVLTKENAAFVVFAIFTMLLLNRFLRIGTVTPQLLAATIIGPALAVLLLVALVGGISEWVRFYVMFVAKSRTNFYSIVAQDGPWYRYAVDFLILSPALVAFACGRMFQIKTSDRADVFMAVLLALTLIPMSSVAYGMSLRYAAFCDVLISWLAIRQVVILSQRFPRVRATIAATALFAILSGIGVSQYVRFFVAGEVYDPTTAALVWTSGMEKDPNPPGTPWDPRTGF